ncbi:hypothetical protein A6J38_01775 [Haemophilus influenzae]|nr:hypothetical protein A6J38_01775 [Haemophilus influenzae]ORJ41223.1 hypothetical protein A4A64_06550 [Haemophilus influenzae]
MRADNFHQKTEQLLDLKPNARQDKDEQNKISCCIDESKRHFVIGLSPKRTKINNPKDITHH